MNYGSLSAHQLKAIVVGADVQWFSQCANHFQDFTEHIALLQTQLDAIAAGFNECWQGPAADAARAQTTEIAAAPEIAIRDGASAANACAERAERMTTIQNQVAAIPLTDTSIGGMVKRAAIGAAIGGPIGSGLALYDQQRKAEQEKRVLLRHVENLDNEGQHLSDTMKNLTFGGVRDRYPAEAMPDVLPGDPSLGATSDSDLQGSASRSPRARDLQPEGVPSDAGFLQPPTGNYSSTANGVPSPSTGPGTLPSSVGSQQPFPATAPAPPAAIDRGNGQGPHGSQQGGINGFAALGLALSGGLIGGYGSVVAAPTEGVNPGRVPGRASAVPMPDEHAPAPGQSNSGKSTASAPAEPGLKAGSAAGKQGSPGDHLSGPTPNARQEEDRELRARPEYLVATDDLWTTDELVPPAVIG